MAGRPKSARPLQGANRGEAVSMPRLVDTEHVALPRGDEAGGVLSWPHARPALDRKRQATLLCSERMACAAMRGGDLFENSCNHSNAWT